MIRPIREIVRDPEAMAIILSLAGSVMVALAILSALAYAAWKLFWWLYA